MTSRVWRGMSVVLAAVIGVAVLADSGRAIAAWYSEGEVPPVTFHSGSLALAKTREVYTVHGKIERNRRTFGAGQECPAKAGYRTCQRFTADQIASLRLVPGDELEIVIDVTASAVGTNLVAEVTVGAQPALAGLPDGATVTTSVTRNGQPTTGGTVRGSDPAAAQQVPWTVATTITTPDRWPARLQGQQITASAFNVVITQTP